jgi:hypothetical protein
LKIVALTTIAPALAELLELADEDTLILKTSEGREFVLTQHWPAVFAILQRARRIS